jgi:hypothetical protein
MRAMYLSLIQQMKKQLGQLATWLDTAEAHAIGKKADPNVLCGLRLVVDQFPLARQVQIACDTAQQVAARLAGKEAPSHPDKEQTVEELRARVRTAIGYLDGFTAKDFDGVEGRTVTQPRWEGQVMSAADYFVEHGVPNFFFHLNHAYAILRHNGDGIGKRDYLGTLSKRAP